MGAWGNGEAVIDPLEGTPWSAPGTVAGFVRSSPNQVLMEFAAREPWARAAERVALDIGCGAGRNAEPLAALGWRVIGTDFSWPMLRAAQGRDRTDPPHPPPLYCLAPMESLPVLGASIDLVIAHGIWNLASSVRQFRRGVDEAARVAKPGAALFVFTFSRHTLPDDVSPVPGEPFVYTQFSGRPQCFLTESQLVDEMARAGFDPDPSVPLREYNRPTPATVQVGGPVIYEAVFTRSERHPGCREA